MTSGRLALLLTSPRVAPGLLSREAWQALEDADRVLAAAVDDPLAEALVEAGVEVRVAGTGPAPGGPAGLARELVDLARTETILWCGSADGDPGLADAVAAEVSRLESPPEVEVVVGSWDVQGGRLLDVVAAMDRLRSPGGCPWDAEQTHETLAPYLLEEAHEVVHAIESGDRAHLAEELGDLLLQVVFHARVAEEAAEGAFDVDTVAGLLVDKLVRRHPHVFADGGASTPEEVEREWERIKAAEASGQAGSDDLLHGIPPGLPVDLASDKALARLRRRGLEPSAGLLTELEDARSALAAADARARAVLRRLADSL